MNNEIILPQTEKDTHWCPSFFFTADINQHNKHVVLER